MSTANVPTRDMAEGDYNLVLNSWLSSWHDSNHDPRNDKRYSPGSWFRKAPGDRFFAVHRPVVTHLLVNSKVTIVAHDPADPDLVWGWIVADKRADGVPVVHFAYVKFGFRGLGVGRALFQAAMSRLGCDTQLVAYTHQNEAAKGLADRLNLMFDPMAVIV